MLPLVPPLAHLVLQGMDEFIAGALHPLLTSAHVLVLVGLGLLLRPAAPARLVAAVGVFSLGAAAGLAATCRWAIPGVPLPVLSGLALGLGGLVALAMPPPGWVRWTAAALAGLALGWDSTPEVAGMAAAKAALGAWAALTLLVLNVAHYSARLPGARWSQTGVRIIGSWIVAISILMLAFWLRR